MVRLTLSVTLIVVTFFICATSAQADNFGRLFPQLPGLTTPTNQQLADLAQTQLDPNTDSGNNCPPGFTSPLDCVGSGFTYFGQFIDHDLTLDTSPPPTAPVDPATLVNSRTFAFDLDSVYGGGPTASPQLYQADGVHLRVQDSNGNAVPDLPRNSDGSAVLGDPRNDENEIISQLHVAFLKSHNRLIDEGHTFVEARAILTHAYQYVVMHDYLPHVLGKAKATGHGLDVKKFTPIEFSVAAFRFGHSQVRQAYFLNDVLNQKVQVFSLDPAVDDLRGGRPLPALHIIEWNYFFPELQDPDDAEDVANANTGRRVDPLISSSLFALPIPGAEAAGSNVLAFRNMLRAKFYGLPSGQSVARQLGLPVITSAALNLGPGFENGTPLWYYVLAESQRVENGARLGPVGSAIVRASFNEALKRTSSGITSSFRPDPEMAGDDGKLTIADFLVFSGLFDE